MANYGKIFLGDGGAYHFGFAVGCAAVLLVWRNPAIPAWAPLTVCAYPVLEVAFSVVRKFRRTGYHPGQPDRVHLHMLVHRRVEVALVEGPVSHPRIDVVPWREDELIIVANKAKLGNPEMIQVHPTAIPGEDKCRLISESASGSNQSRFQSPKPLSNGVMSSAK